jgi:hypothetical protein
VDVRSPDAAGAQGTAAGRRAGRGDENEDAANILPQQRGAADAAQQAQQQDLEMPDPGEDYKGWLAAKKAQWRRSREARKRKRPAGDGRGDGGGAAGRQRTGDGLADVGAMFQQQAAAATAAHWQIIGIAPTRQAGAFVLPSGCRQTNASAGVVITLCHMSLPHRLACDAAWFYLTSP